MQRPSARLVSKTLPIMPPHCSSTYQKESKKPKPKATMHKTLYVQPYSRSSLALVASLPAVHSYCHGSLHPTLRIKDMIVHRHRPNKMGFKKVDPVRWEFASKGFLRGQKHLLKTLKRRRALSHLPSQQQSYAQLLEVGQFGFDGEVDQLRCDKSILLAELVKLKQEQQNMQAHIMAIEERLQDTEQKQHQMMAFLARSLHNPNFLHQMAQQNDRKKQLAQEISKKRRRLMYQGYTNCDKGTSIGWEYGYEVSELESLALEMQGFGRSSDSGEEHEEKDEGELSDEFWVELLCEGMIDEGLSSSEGKEAEEDDL